MLDVYTYKRYIVNMSKICNKKSLCNENQYPLIDVDSWYATDNKLLTMTSGYYLENCTFSDIYKSLEISLDKKHIAQLSEILFILIKEYEKKD